MLFPEWFLQIFMVIFEWLKTHKTFEVLHHFLITFVGIWHHTLLSFFLKSKHKTSIAVYQNWSYQPLPGSQSVTLISSLTNLPKTTLGQSLISCYT